MSNTDSPIKVAPVVEKKAEKEKQKKKLDNAAVQPAPSIPESPTLKHGSHGRWSPEEKLLFLHGLKLFGRGRWKKIRTFLPLRSLVQIKSHGQKVLKRADTGEDIWAPLREKPALVQKLVAKQAKSPTFLMPSIPYQASIARPRQVPKPKLKPRPVTASEEPLLGGVRFSVGSGRRENEAGAAVFRTQFGGTGNLSFSFRDAVPQHVEDEESSVPSYSPDTFDPSDCRTPERPDPAMIKSTAVLAATALCQLSARWDEKSSSGDQERVNIISP